MMSRILALGVLVGTAVALGPRVVVDSRSTVPDEWLHAGASPADEVVPLGFAIKQSEAGMERLFAFVDQVSDPKSPFYGKYMSLEEVGEMTADREATATVTEFLSNYAVLDSKTTPNGDFITVKVTVATAEEMLDTKFSAYKHATRGVTVHRCDFFTLPLDVHASVRLVAHTTSLPILSLPPVIQSFETAGLRGSNDAGQSTPSVISKYYGISQNDVSNPKATNAVFETIGQSYSPSDLTAYDEKFGVPPQKIAKVIGPNNPASCSENPNNCVEAELDVQVITAIAQESTTTFWSIPGTESFYQWMEAVAADSNPPLVHSISYGEPEAESSTATDKLFNDEVAKMASRGLSILVASGDDGVAGSQARSSKAACGFNPSYPATAAYVTAVGGTQGPEDDTTEIACQSNKGGGITSGGGFSAVFDRPTWQSSAVEAYLSNPSANLPPKSMFASTGRGYPDVALMAHNYPIAVGGAFYAGSGTSASTPLFAAMLTLVNSARLTAGKASVGFANPALYSFDSSVFNDITSGENQCAAGGSAPICCDYGFTATQGWDAVTGLGSPHFEQLKAAWLALP